VLQDITANMQWCIEGTFRIDCFHITHDCDSSFPSKQLVLVVCAAHVGYDAFLCQLKNEAEMTGVICGMLNFCLIVCTSFRLSCFGIRVALFLFSP